MPPFFPCLTLLYLFAILSLRLPPACYGYNPQQANGTLSWVCPKSFRIEALGVSFNDREPPGNKDLGAANMYDQGIIFLNDPRPGPFFKYNYIENINTASATNSWVSRSYVSGGSQGGSCGCNVCAGMSCNLSKAGPYTGPLTPDQYNVGNMAYKPNLEACGGSSGNCLDLNGDGCCVGTDSYEFTPKTACENTCENYWSSITSKRPLEALWNEVQIDLPAPLPERTPARRRRPHRT